jgi:two-component SAPR family response regulator
MYLSRDGSKLVAVMFSPVEPGVSSEVSVYTLAYPPLSKQALFQEEERATGHFALAGMAAAVILSLIYAFIACGRKKRMKNRLPETENEDGSGNEDSGETEIIIKPMLRNVKKQAIFLFGGFQAIDREGCDVTGDFATILKQLFLLILLYTFKNGKGISSTKLEEILWIDKTKENAKNNRNVSINRLRQIIEKIGDIRIKNKNSLWTVEFQGDVYCDYCQALALMETMKDRLNRTEGNVRRLLSAVSAGEFLPNVQTEWIDPFKADFSNDLTDLLLELIRQTGLDLSQQERITMADSILIHDSLNEEALKFKCQLLVGMGKNGLAKKAYASFAKEYFTSFNTQFNIPFNEIIA